MRDELSAAASQRCGPCSEVPYEKSGSKLSGAALCGIAGQTRQGEESASSLPIADCKKITGMLQRGELPPKIGPSVARASSGRPLRWRASDPPLEVVALSVVVLVADELVFTVDLGDPAG